MDGTGLTRTPRVVVCGTGQYGSMIAHTVIEKGYELVAAFNRAGSKVGKDIGSLAGMDHDTGVVVQHLDSADFKQLDVDVGIVVQTNDLRANMSSYRKLLSAGVNVLCMAMEAYYPFGSDPEAASEIDALAKENNVTFSGTGIHDLSRIWTGLLATGQCTNLRSITHSSLTDNIGQGTPEQILRDYAVGWTVERYFEVGVDKARLWATFTYVLQHVLSARGYTVTSAKTEVEPVVWDEPYDSDYLNCTIPAGKVLGTRTRGWVETREGVTGFVSTEARMCKPGDEEHTLWQVDGDPRVEIRTRRLDPDFTNAATVFNRIKDVIAAPAGVVPVSRLGPLHAPDLLTSSART